MFCSPVYNQKICLEFFYFCTRSSIFSGYPIKVKTQNYQMTPQFIRGLICFSKVLMQENLKIKVIVDSSHDTFRHTIKSCHEAYVNSRTFTERVSRSEFNKIHVKNNEKWKYGSFYWFYAIVQISDA